MPALIEVREQPIKNTIDGGIVGKAADGTGSSTDFPEDPFNGIGGSDLDVMFLRALEEVQEFFQIRLKTGNRLGSFSSPVSSPAMESLDGLTSGSGLIDSVGFSQAWSLDLPAKFIGDVAQLMNPASLARDVRIDGFQSCMKTFASVGDDELRYL